MSKIAEIAQAIETGKAKLVPALVQEALDAGEDPSAILNEGMIQAMTNTGERFTREEIFVPEMLVAAKAMKKGLAVLTPHLAGDSLSTHGKCVIGTVQGDLHDIGKNLVATMIGSSGFEVVDLGVDVSADAFLAAVRENPDCTVVALSTLLTTTMPAMRSTVEALRQADLPAGTRIIVGGAPVTQAFADEIGADGYSADAASAAKLAVQLVS